MTKHNEIQNGDSADGLTMKSSKPDTSALDTWIHSSYEKKNAKNPKVGAKLRYISKFFNKNLHQKEVEEFNILRVINRNKNSWEGFEHEPGVTNRGTTQNMTKTSLKHQTKVQILCCISK